MLSAVSSPAPRRCLNPRRCRSRHRVDAEPTEAVRRRPRVHPPGGADVRLTLCGGNHRSNVCSCSHQRLPAAPLGCIGESEFCPDPSPARLGFPRGCHVVDLWVVRQPRNRLNPPQQRQIRRKSLAPRTLVVSAAGHRGSPSLRTTATARALPVRNATTPRLLRTRRSLWSRNPVMVTVGPGRWRRTFVVELGTAPGLRRSQSPAGIDVAAQRAVDVTSPSRCRDVLSRRPLRDSFSAGVNASRQPGIWFGERLQALETTRLTSSPVDEKLQRKMRASPIN